MSSMRLYKDQSSVALVELVEIVNSDFFFSETKHVTFDEFMVNPGR